MSLQILGGVPRHAHCVGTPIEVEEDWRDWYVCVVIFCFVLHWILFLGKTHRPKRPPEDCAADPLPPVFGLPLSHSHFLFNFPIFISTSPF